MAERFGIDIGTTNIGTGSTTGITG